VDRSVIAVLRGRYGASPWHLAAHLAAFAVAAYALGRVLDPRYSRGLDVVVWLVGAAVIHDLVLVPAYSLLDAVARRASRRAAPGGVPAINHLRFPVAISGALLLVYFPLVFAKADGNYVRATGHHVTGFGTRWLAITAVLFCVSGLAYLVRVRAQRARARLPRRR
jgi:Na+/melibiose symporter-like transporter